MWTLALKYGPRILAGLALAALIGWGYHAVYQRGYRASEASWQARWTARDLAETRAKDVALAAQKAAADAADARNAEILGRLNDATAQAAAARRDADDVRRLLYYANHPAGGAVSPAAGQPATAAPGTPAGDGGAGRLSELLTAAAAECRANADDWDALWAELGPQMVGAK